MDDFKNLKRLYRQLTEDIWIEMPLYYYNLGRSIRFEIAEHGQYEEKNIMSFILSLCNDMFFSDKLIAVQITDAEVRCIKTISNLLGENNKSRFVYTFMSKAEDEDYQVMQKARVYIINNNEDVLKVLLSRAYEMKLDSQLFLVDVNQKCAINIYDERGCDVVILDTTIRRTIYNKYSDWVFEYNREEIELSFK
ncbi:MAG: DUF3885 domain-containing protein [Clostridiales bacterium]|nr:DUF3885 domain-containing protein [Clostridiales bacterium]